MPTTNPSNIVYPDGGSAYNYVADLGAMAQSIQNALSKQGNAFSGTDAERVAFTTEARPGTLWSNTDADKKMYQFRDGKWFPDYEFVPLTLTKDGNTANGNFEFNGPVGVHVENFGRKATLTGHMKQKSVFDWDENSTWILGYVPNEVAPAYITQQTGLLYSPVTNITSANFGVSPGGYSQGRIRGAVWIAPYERTRNMSTDRTADLNLPAITWYLNS